MITEVFLPDDNLADFISGYFLIEVDSYDDFIPLKKFESGVSLGICLGKPFEFGLKSEGISYDRIKFQYFEHPMLFTKYDSQNELVVRGNVRLLFVIFTPFGMNLLFNQQNPQFDERIVPLSRLGLPLFNLRAKRKLRYNQDNVEGVKLIDDEFRRFYRQENNPKRSDDFISPSIYPFFPEEKKESDKS
ncbi:hypothetical protein [Mongoliitalea daihaiensis]|uniref:hypothetical protein n=1 Tax=Mongoliitalea daihaiensis TaxID=2782006 RepID=UPI001F326CA5|nr:hypothetical protein [Mongoliitalea daihaiensis]UJP63894.1 hypothetical protein IPZ59_13795 [Mongoliitalea daihaiensis]